MSKRTFYQICIEKDTARIEIRDLPDLSVSIKSAKPNSALLGGL